MNKIQMIVVLATSFAMVACENDANAPSSVEDQMKAVRGSKPTSDQLAAAMKNYKGLASPPPVGGAAGPGASAGAGTPPATSGTGGPGTPKH